MYRKFLQGDVYSIDVQGLGGSKNEMKIYSAANKIISIENGKLVSSNGFIYKLEVKFEKFSTKIKLNHN